jgi:hypothetical protein
MATRILDIFHTALVIAGLWTYMITYFGHSDHIDIIPWYVGVCNTALFGLTLIIYRTISVGHIILPI